MGSTSATKDLVLVEYPGLVENADKALETLTYLRRVHEPECMNLSFGPEQRFIQPITGSFHPCQKVLLKVRVPKGPSPAGKAVLVQDAQVIGPVRQVVRFRRMSDFQYDVKIPDQWAGLESAIRNLDPGELDRFARMILEAKDEDPRPGMSAFEILPPPITSHFDFPVSILGPDISLNISRQTRIRQGGAIENKGKLPWLVSFYEADLPKAPSEEALANMMYLRHYPIDQLKGLFDQRPIASRQFVADLTGIPYADLAKVLPLLAFCYVDGPWRNCWVRYGVDPRSDSQYRVYQMLTFRTNIIVEAESQTAGGPLHLFTGDNSALALSSHQFCDLQYEPLQDIVNNPHGLQQVCQKTEGWYPKGTVKRMRQAMREWWLRKLEATNPDLYARHLELARSSSRYSRKAPSTQDPGSSQAGGDALDNLQEYFFRLSRTESTVHGSGGEQEDGGEEDEDEEDAFEFYDE